MWFLYIFFWFLKLNSAQMYTPRKINSGVLFHDTLFISWNFSKIKISKGSENDAEFCKKKNIQQFRKKYCFYECIAIKCKIFAKLFPYFSWNSRLERIVYRREIQIKLKWQICMQRENFHLFNRIFNRVPYENLHNFTLRF